MMTAQIKILLNITAALAVTGSSVLAQTITVPAVPTVSAVSSATITPQATVVSAYSAEQLDQLTSTVALYPDPLLANTLAAATYPNEIAAAAQWLAYYPSPTQDIIDAQQWQPSVKVLMHYPTVLNLMAQYPQWTAALGNAFMTQPADVMLSVQRLRAQAYAMGNLVTTTQQQVLIAGNTIQIVPVTPTVIYVPVYDSRVVYVQRPAANRPFVNFSFGVTIGEWMNIDIDWSQRRVITGVANDRRWYEHRNVPVYTWSRDKKVVIQPTPRVITKTPVIVETNHNAYRGWGPQPQKTSVFEDRTVIVNREDRSRQVNVNVNVRPAPQSPRQADNRNDNRRDDNRPGNNRNDNRSNQDNNRSGPDRDHDRRDGR